MEKHVAYCSACARKVTILIGSPDQPAAADDSLMHVTCADYSTGCPSSNCPLNAAPPADFDGHSEQAPEASD